MSEDATSQPSDTTTDTTSATEDDQAQQMLAVAATQTSTDQAGTAEATTTGQAKPEQVNQSGDDELGDNGKRALVTERQNRKAAEKKLKLLEERVQQYEDEQKTELQKAQEAAKRYESELTSTRVANARLMAAVAHDLPPDLIDLLGDGTEEQIDARAKLLAEKLAAVKAPAEPAAAEPAKPSATPTRPVESLTPGGRPATQEPEDPNDWLRRLAGRAP